MNFIKAFIDNIEKYYGEYANDTVRLIMSDYLSKYNEDELAELFDLVTNTFSNSYKMPPDKFRFENAFEQKYKQSGLNKVGDHYEDINKNVFDKKMKKIGHYDSGRFIPNLSNPDIREKVLELGDSRITPDRYIEVSSELFRDIVIKGE